MVSSVTLDDYIDGVAMSEEDKKMFEGSISDIGEDGFISFGEEEETEKEQAEEEAADEEITADGNEAAGDEAEGEADQGIMADGDDAAREEEAAREEAEGEADQEIMADGDDAAGEEAAGEAREDRVDCARAADEVVFDDDQTPIIVNDKTPLPPQIWEWMERHDLNSKSEKFLGEQLGALRLINDNSQRESAAKAKIRRLLKPPILRRRKQWKKRKIWFALLKFFVTRARTLNL